MFKIVKKAVSKELVEFCYNYFLMKRKVTRVLHETKYIDSLNEDWGYWSDEMVPGTYSHYSDMAMETLLVKLHPLMEIETKTKLYPTYSYARIYKKGDVLYKHTDRASCAISTTLNLGGNPWPIFLKAPEKEEISVLLEPGDMLIYDGANHEHWREEFTGDHCGQVFLHYNEISKGDKYKYDERPFLGLPKIFKKEKTNLKNNFTALIKNQKLYISDSPFVIKNFLENTEDYLNWGTLNEAISNTNVEWELIDRNSGRKLAITQQDRKYIWEQVLAGSTFVILNSCILPSLTPLVTDIQEVFPVICDIHIYGSKSTSNSFGPHADNPSNFIIQAIGNTDWVIFKERLSSIMPLGIPDNMDLTPELEVTLSPGDLLYIPSKMYHIALPNEPRLSMSIPCLEKGKQLERRTDNVPTYSS